ncbi:hypothetical protein GOBAR_AA33961 [Gossypium barbadense]|uniref:POX domain-containing protein n=1 Tax=Gossypium barbadense TaxID=3634 RepID=A0A2P5W6L6_GOSBA|nr:hypothetical protein GOBAR_AA33961 [Gossypium barbadense]
MSVETCSITGTPSCSKAVNESTTEFYQHAEFITGLEVGTESSGPWQDDSSLRCVFPCEGNERPSQGLSLSLSSSNPTTIGVQSFELKQVGHGYDNQHDDMRFIGSSSSSREAFFAKPANLHHHQGEFQLRNSKYLGPTQELLNEFCSLGMKQMDASKQKQSIHKGNKQWDDENGVAGIGAASVYSALASKAMSRHFRCLRDGIVGQIQTTRKAMGEKNPVAPGTTKGETPRLRILDQALRQQRAYQQMNMMESHPWRPQRGLPERSVSVSNWFINARVRLWKPMVEEMYLEETKEHENNNMASPNGATNTNQNDQKPTPDQLVRVDSESASNGGGVSLTLGLQQHGGNNGVSLAFSPTSQSSLFYPRSDQIEDCQPVQYSLLDGEGQHLPYRNLMGAQLLHDLAG